MGWSNHYQFININKEKKLELKSFIPEKIASITNPLQSIRKFDRQKSHNYKISKKYNRIFLIKINKDIPKKPKVLEDNKNKNQELLKL